MRAPEFWSGTSFGARMARAALAPASLAYGATVSHKAAHTTPYRSKARVICIGNLTAGGTGKTPVAIAIARMLLERYSNVWLLTRGYGGRKRGPAFVHPARDTAADVGDEALLLAGVAPTIIARDRAAGARLADAQGADVIVMDDGHQNFTLAKDLSLVVIDSMEGFGNGRILPAGPLRESIEKGLARADAAIVLGDRPFTPGFEKPILRARLVPVEEVPLNGEKIVAFAGIGYPEKFFHMLRQMGAQIVATYAFPDHHVYHRSDLARLRHQSGAKSAALITTEKDFVRLSLQERDNIRCLAVRAVFDDPALSELLERGPQTTGGSA